MSALFSGVAFQFSGFMVVSVVFTMVIAAAAWLPLLLGIIERVVQKQEEKGTRAFRPIPYVVSGAAVLGLVVLAGHPEFLYYTLLVSGAYAAVRLLAAWRRVGRGNGRGRPPNGGGAKRLAAAAAFPAVGGTGAWLVLVALLGLAFGAVQLLPLYELLQLNFREGSASYQQVVGWAWPQRHLLTFALPDVFGNPSHHRWLDVQEMRWRPVTTNFGGESVEAIFWGIKNYVEGGSYLGVATWLLAAIAVATALWRRISAAGQESADEGQVRPCALGLPTLLFCGLALLSLLFAFGTPLYTLLYYGLPGWDQLRSPFRWVFPFTLSMSVLGGIGLEQALALRGAGRERPIPSLRRVRLDLRRLVALLSLGCGAAGLASLLAAAGSLAAPSPYIGLAQRIVEGSQLAQAAFADGAVFWGYQFVGLVKFGAFALFSGLLVWLLARRLRAGGDGSPGGGGSAAGRSASGKIAAALPFAVVFVLALDLYAAHGTFNPAADPDLSPLVNVPPAVQFINRQEGTGSNPDVRHPPFRFTTFDRPGAKTFNANLGMYYGWQDIRGYDSTILKQYANLMNRVADQSQELPYNRIAPLYAQGTADNGGNPFAALENPLLDLLGVKYLLTELVVPNSDTWKKVYEDRAVRIYENLEVFPRAFIATEAVVAPPEEQPLLRADLRRTVFIEAPPADVNALTPSSPRTADAAISRYTANTVFVDVNLSDRGWLVLADAYDAGWRAYLRPFGAHESAEQEATIVRANSALRAVYLPQPGQWTVRFVYSPLSFRLGLYISFLGVMLSLLLLLWWLWGRYYRPKSTASEVRTVAKNSVVSMSLNLANRVIYYVFAMLYTRLLGPSGTGQYAWVVAVYGVFEILSRYGLGTLLTREVATDKDQSSRYLTNVLALRTLLWAGTVILMALTVGAVRVTSGIGREEFLAISVFALVMLVSNWSDAFSNLFYAFEKMEYPSGLGIAMALLQVALGAMALLLGWGIVGLAWMALVVNLVQLSWLAWLVRSTLFAPEWRWDWSLQKEMLATSGPLMLNHLLATLFWRMDIWLLRPLAGAASAGLYSAAIKYIDGLNFIPSTFTLAIFPLMSRFARQKGEELLRAYVLSVRILLLLSLPVAMTVALFSHVLISLLGGARFSGAMYEVAALPSFLCRLAFWTPGLSDCGSISYLGGSALALQVIIWSIPIGFVNSVTQYVLIAANQQGYLTRAFVLGVLFNLIGNLLLIPTFAYIGAAAVTILSELCLLYLFGRRVRRDVGATPWPDLVWRPIVSAAAMGTCIYALTAAGASPWLAALPSWAVYVASFSLLGGWNDADLRFAARSLIHGGLRWQAKESMGGA